MAVPRRGKVPFLQWTLDTLVTALVTGQSASSSRLSVVRLAASLQEKEDRKKGTVLLTRGICLWAEWSMKEKGPAKDIARQIGFNDQYLVSISKSD